MPIVFLRSCLIYHGELCPQARVPLDAPCTACALTALHFAAEQGHAGVVQVPLSLVPAASVVVVAPNESEIVLYMRAPLSASLVSPYLLTIPLCLDLPRHHRGTLIDPKDRLLYKVEGVSECLNSLACPKQRLNRCFGVGPGAADRRCSGKHHRQRGTHTIACCGGCGPRCGAAAAAGRGRPAYQQRNVEGCGLH